MSDFQFVLSQSDDRPMYLQIIEQIKSRVMSGDWQAGFKLPSIRELAVASSVSVITVKRAYQELEAEGVITTQQGKGSFIAQQSGLDTRLKQQELDNQLRSAIELGRNLGQSISDLQHRLMQLGNDDDKQEEQP